MNRTELLSRYRSGYDAVAAALAGASDTELDRPAGDDEWTARMVVHHLADSEANAFIRLRRLIAEPNPTITGYDEAEYARRLHYDRPIAASLAVFKAVRKASAELLDSLSPAEWDRSGTHSENGEYSIDHWLGIYTAHAHDHAEQIRQARNG